MKKVFFFLFSIFLVGCSVMQKDTFTQKVDKNETILVMPFKNLSETPYAGVKASLIAEGVLRSRGFKVVRGYDFDGHNVKLKNITAPYILEGKVIEWRYKTGIDGEPAVSIYVQLVDSNNSIIFSSVGSNSDWGHKSASICAQELIKDIF